MGQAKICVKCPTEAEMHEIQTKAQEAGLITYFVVRDGTTSSTWRNTDITVQYDLLLFQVSLCVLFVKFTVPTYFVPN